MNDTKMEAIIFCNSVQLEKCGTHVLELAQVI